MDRDRPRAAAPASCAGRELPLARLPQARPRKTKGERQAARERPPGPRRLETRPRRCRLTGGGCPEPPHLAPARRFRSGGGRGGKNEPTDPPPRPPSQPLRRESVAP